MKQPWPTDEDVRRDALFAVWVWGGIGGCALVGAVVLFALLVAKACA